VLVGPGFGLAESTAEFVAGLLESAQQGVKLPGLVLDADGLKLLARSPDWAARLPGPAVLTPHPGEMSILTGLSKETVQQERLETALRFSQEWGHVVVLKGAFSVIAAPDGQVAIIPVATPALARAGTGDVLAGLIAGLRAQGVQAFQAATAGAWIHAFAGLQAAARLGGSASVLAGDVLHESIQVLADLGGAGN
jgi:NAD(P)H-hydrate epimerase